MRLFEWDKYKTVTINKSNIYWLALNFVTQLLWYFRRIGAVLELTSFVVLLITLKKISDQNHSNKILQWALFNEQNLWFLLVCAGLDWFGILELFRMNVSFMDECAIYEWMCHLWMNVLLSNECTIFGWMCHLWMNLLLLDESATFGWMCYFGWMCHFWMNVPFMDECAVYW